jgi:hypothetical protein
MASSSTDPVLQDIKINADLKVWVDYCSSRSSGNFADDFGGRLMVPCIDALTRKRRNAGCLRVVTCVEFVTLADSHRTHGPARSTQKILALTSFFIDAFAYTTTVGLRRIERFHPLLISYRSHQSLA